MEKLHLIWNAWKRFGEFIGEWVARIVLTIFYFTIFLPFGLVSRLWRDPLDCRDISEVSWTERPALNNSLEKARKLG